MPKHKQAGHTTVLTKYTQTALQNACNAGATTQDIDGCLRMLRCGPPLQTFAAAANLSGRRIQAMRTKQLFAGAPLMSAI
jgi:hypothetical protein